MRSLPFTRRTFGLLLASALMHPVFRQTAAAQEDRKKIMNYRIGIMNEGSLEVLGTVTFDAAFNPTLTTDAEGGAATKLRKDFEAAVAEESFRVKRSKRVKNADGSVTNQLLGVMIRKGTENYPQGLIDYLSSKHGYLARPAT